jgi:uncharacterized integral membrane protein
MAIRVLAFVVLFILVIVFMMQNVSPVTITFLVWRQPVPLIGVICILALAGFILGYLTALMGGRKRKK